MYYSELFFKKDLYSITEDDVIEFFTQSVEETSILEFKSGNVSIEKIYPEVTALHNSQGGLLIIGSPIPKKDENGKEYFEGELTMSSFKNKDWLYQKIYSKISPPPVNIKIHDVKCQHGSVFVLDIPKSVNPPHQNLEDGKYYIRYETETKFATHGLVEALFNRRKEPVMDYELDLLNDNSGKNNSMKITIELKNLSDIPIINPQYLFYFFNLKNVYSVSKEADLKVKNLFGLSQVLDSTGKKNDTLVKGLYSTVNYDIIHFDEPFIVTPNCWSENMNLSKQGFLVSPKQMKYRKFDIPDGIFEEALLQIIDIISKIDDSNDDRKEFDGLVEKIKTITDVLNNDM